MVKKGLLSEIFSKALHQDNPYSYTIGYQNYDTVKETTLADFIKFSDNFETIPASRIQYVRKGKRVLFRKSKDKVK